MHTIIKLFTPKRKKEKKNLSPTCQHLNGSVHEIQHNYIWEKCINIKKIYMYICDI